jgi:hypothetical protein
VSSPAPRPGPADAAAFRERLSPAPWIWASVAGIAAMAGLAVAPLGVPVALLSAAAVGVLLVVLLVRGTPLVAVADGMLIACRAGVPVRVLGRVEVLDAERMRHARGPDLDARAYLCLRGWIATGVLVELRDAEDPTPYWLISSRRPGELAAAITAAAATPG